MLRRRRPKLRKAQPKRRSAKSPYRRRTKRAFGKDWKSCPQAQRIIKQGLQQGLATWEIANQVIDLPLMDPHLKDPGSDLMRYLDKADGGRFGKVRHHRTAARHRRAMSESLLEDLIDTQAYVDTIDVLDRDEQSIDLMNQIYEYFWERLQLDGNESDALSRFMAVIKNGDRWDLALMRNNIFKAANSLGIKLPSGMF